MTAHAKLDFPTLCSVVQGTLYGLPGPAPVRTLITDSRSYRGETDAVFFALTGAVHNGHDHIQELIRLGMRLFVVEKRPTHLPEGVGFCRVESSVDALQRLGAWSRDRFKGRVVAIAGSNGKTIVKEWAFQLLQPDFDTVRSPKSYNSQIGVPLSLWNLEPQHELALIEVGISQPGEMQRQQVMVRPDIGLFTNLGSAHQEHFRSMDHKLGEKLSLFDHAQTMVYCADQPGVEKRLKKKEHLDLWGWSAREKARIWFDGLEHKHARVSFKVHGYGPAFRVQLPFIDAASLENARHLIALMAVLGVDRACIKRRLELLEPVVMRLSLEPGRRGSLLINDSYNSDLESLRIALDFVSAQRKKRPAMLILSDLEQTGMEPAQWLKAVEKLVRPHGLERVIGVGPVWSSSGEGYLPQGSFYPDARSLGRAEPQLPPAGHLVLLKGARSFGFEKLAEQWVVKRHQTELQIDLDAMAANLNAVRSKLDRSVKIMAVVKAFAYGVGGVEVASMLQFQKVDYLAVAYTDEGIELREAGIGLPIMVMNPEEEALDRLIEHRLEPEIYSFRMLGLFVKALLRSDGRSEAYPIHLKMDTGMHRLGFAEQDVEALCEELGDQHRLRIASVFTHLAATEDMDERKRTLIQIKRFEQMCTRLAQSTGQRFDRHALNTAGIEHYPEYAFEMVRIGLGLYGMGPGSSHRALGLKTHISQIKFVRKGESVGYNYSYVAERDLRSATIAIGYADGFDRRFSNGKGRVWIRGKFAPVIGKVCMDLCMVDVTGIDCAEGDPVEIFGEHLDVAEWARSLDTIPYEVLTGLSSRIKRVYLQG
ncbi:bifunctional UDP-N-acetylmuramoyl-tripeptide:D-alanyl-D-alanine ligase/alanine racemase [bacterium]|nr:bifunctional UDP-N-acetylmuramoyl-tripeptide:D-alanyl-D-alanine ligase/alanine racemase [bacterium]